MIQSASAPTDPATAPSPIRARLVAAGSQLAVGLFPFVLALAIGAVVLAAAGHPPLSTYAIMAHEAVGTSSRLASTLASSTPLLFTGLATAVAFRVGIFNVGVEGAFVGGGLTAAVFGFTFTGLPGPVLALASLGAGMVVGAMICWGPGLLRAYLGVDEVVTTLMMNFIVLGIVGFLVSSYFLAPGVANNATPLVADHGRLPRLLPPSTLHAGLLIALTVVVIVGLVSRRSVVGFELRMVGINPRFALAQGIDVSRGIALAMLVSGAIGGLGGAAHAIGSVGRYVEGFSPDYGFTGIAVALLGRNSPVGVVIAALLFGGLATAGATMQLFSDVPYDIVRVLEGVIMIFAVVQILRVRRISAVD